jgi:hypothetical protein
MKGTHYPLFGFTRFACRRFITIMKTNNVGYFSLVKCGGWFSQLRVVLNYNKSTPALERGLVLQRDDH